MANSRLVSESLLKLYRVPGAVVTCVDDDHVRTVWRGKADEGSGQDVVRGTRFQVASLSKIVTSWAAMRLVADGHIDLDEPVEPRLRRWKFPASLYVSDEITLRSLLTHTSGLPASSSNVFLDRDQLPTLVEALNGVGGSASATPENPVGHRFRYSNLGYAVIELLIEELTGETFTDWTSANVLAPLGMVNSSFDRKGVVDPETAAPHKRRGRPMPRGCSNQHAAGGLIAVRGRFGALGPGHDDRQPWPTRWRTRWRSDPIGACRSNVAIAASGLWAIWTSMWRIRCRSGVGGVGKRRQIRGQSRVSPGLAQSLLVSAGRS